MMLVTVENAGVRSRGKVGMKKPMEMIVVESEIYHLEQPSEGMCEKKSQEASRRAFEHPRPRYPWLGSWQGYFLNVENLKLDL